MNPNIGIGKPQHYYYSAILFLILAGMTSLSSLNCKKEKKITENEKTESSSVRYYKIPIGSMKPTIQPGDTVAGQIDAYENNSPKRGDVIAFRPPSGISDGDMPFIQRVIAVEGDTIEIRKGNKVFLNGQLKNEPYAMFDSRNEMLIVPPMKVPKGGLFVLGDNRGHCYDSSLWRDPILPVKNVISKVDRIVLPLRRAGNIN